MQHENGLTQKALLSLVEEHLADEHAARVRDYGEAGAADCEAGSDEAYRTQAAALGSEPPAAAVGEMDRTVADLERGWRHRADAGYEQMLADKAAPATPGRSSDKEPER